MTRASDDAASPSARPRTCPSLRRRVDSCATHASAAARHALRLNADACACSRPMAVSVRGSGQQPRRFGARRAHAVAPCKTLGCSRRRRWHGWPTMHSKEGPDRGASARLLGVHSWCLRCSSRGIARSTALGKVDDGCPHMSWWRRRSCAGGSARIARCSTEKNRKLPLW